MNLKGLWERHAAVRWAVIIGVVAAALAVAIMLSIAGPPEANGSTGAAWLMAARAPGSL